MTFEQFTALKSTQVKSVRKVERPRFVRFDGRACVVLETKGEGLLVIQNLSGIRLKKTVHELDLES